MTRISTSCASASLILAVLSGQPAFAAAPAAPRAVLLKPAPKGKPAPEAIAQLCASLPEPCDPAQLSAFVPSRPMPVDLYLIDESKPALLAAKFGPTGALQLQFRQDFGQPDGVEESTETAAGWADEGPRRIFPALYPVSPTQWAVALLSRRSEMYSGGGASFERADFIPLGTDAALHAGIPFSCNKMIRACFSEADYRSGRPCHDEYSGRLSIRYQTRPGQADYRWQFFWHADGDRRGKRFKSADEAGFCGGDQG
ncbi:hypothetical protein Q9Q94_13595 [Uliginosibacterium sp. 31-16]|uniref:hypothetical protein n=1 Tax=Uliginosibacterium sp. 31-16 TaxID=3068315 RepID=UPI00273D6D20|nr:hypothetical protein [Uliginosibacterium sp. 31-16]MDP5240573.1 hypothetical protein [Uliginosibacterium sp. 31-16]